MRLIFASCSPPCFPIQTDADQVQQQFAWAAPGLPGASDPVGFHGFSGLGFDLFGALVHGSGHLRQCGRHEPIAHTVDDDDGPSGKGLNGDHAGAFSDARKGANLRTVSRPGLTVSPVLILRSVWNGTPDCRESSFSADWPRGSSRNRKSAVEGIAMFITTDHTAFGMLNQPPTVEQLKYRAEMKIDSKKVLWARLGARVRAMPKTTLCTTSFYGNQAFTQCN